MSELFRLQALDAKNQSWLGTVRIATPISHALWSIAAVSISVVIVLWLFCSHYTRREHVTGSLVPQGGMINMIARNAGTVSQIYVKEGASVKAGDTLFALSGERSSEAIGDTDAAITAQLQHQKNRLQADLLDSQRLRGQQEQGLRKQQIMLRAQLGEFDGQLDIIGKQLKSYRSLLVKIQPLEAKGYVSAFQTQQQEDLVLGAESRQKELARQRYETSQQLSTISDQLAQLPLATEGKLNDFRRQYAQVEQLLVQNEADRSTLIRAKEDATVSSILIKTGQVVAQGEQLLALIPANSSLQAQLFVPSSAIGFIHAGTRVSLHYQAFPYQKFGIQHGVVRQVSRSALTPSAITELLGEQKQPDEPLYRIRVALEAQTVRAYGKNESLKPGMAVDADLLLDRRRLIEWIFEPIYGMRHRALENQ